MKLNKKEGSVENFIAMAILTMVALLVLFAIKSKEINIVSNYTSDALVTSNLAAATVDLKEYGTSNKIINNDFEKSFNEFSRSIKENLKLDNGFVPISKNMISSKVTIDTFSIYNVVGNDIQLTKRQANGNVTKQVFTNGLGNTKTPDGVIINTTTIYSKIGFELKGYLKNKHYAYKENSVDITDKD